MIVLVWTVMVIKPAKTWWIAFSDHSVCPVDRCIILSSLSLEYTVRLHICTCQEIDDCDGVCLCVSSRLHWSTL